MVQVQIQVQVQFENASIVQTLFDLFWNISLSHSRFMIDIRTRTRKRRDTIDNNVWFLLLSSSAAPTAARDLAHTDRHSLDRPMLFHVPQWTDKWIDGCTNGWNDKPACADVRTQLKVWKVEEHRLNSVCLTFVSKLSSQMLYPFTFYGVSWLLVIQFQ